MGYRIRGQGHSKGSNDYIYPDDTFQTTEHFVTKLGIVVHHQTWYRGASL